MSIEEDEAITYIFKWNALSDACPRCQALNGREWRDQNIYQGTLWDVIYGDIWNLDAGHSMAHCRHDSCNCRCQLAVRVECDWSKYEELKQLQVTLQNCGVETDLPVSVYDLSLNISEARQETRAFKEEMRSLRTEARETNEALTMYLALGRRAGSEDIRELIRLFQQGRITAEMFTRAIITLTTASGPWGWALGLGQLALTGLMLADMAEIRRPRY